MSRGILQVAASLTLLTGVACGAGSQPASPAQPISASATTEPELGAARTPEHAQGESGTATTEGEPEEAVSPEDAEPVVEEPVIEEPAAATPIEPPAPPAPPPLPSEVLGTDGVAFLLDDPGSDLKETLTERCQQKITEDDPAKLAECRLAERDKFGADVFVFKKLPGGTFKWVVYQRSRRVLKEVYSARVRLVDERQASFKLRPLSGQGVRHVFRGRADVSVTMPSKNELVLEDPTFGKLVYRAKFGLVGN